MALHRRRFLAAAGLALGGSLASTLPTDDAESRPSSPSRSATPSAHDWPMARYDPAGTGHNPAASGPKDDATVAWTHDATDWFLGTTPPIRRGDTLYAVGNGLLALDVETGDRTFGRPGPYRSSPARVRTDIYETDTLAVTAPSGVYGLNGGGGVEIPVVGGALGIERWTGPTSPGPGFFGAPDSATPVTAGGSIYTAVPGTNAIVALDPNDGEVRWRNAHHEDDGVSAAFNRPAVRDGLVFVTNWPRQVTAYRADTGVQHWQRELDEQLLLAPAATDEGVVVPSREGVRLLDSADGSVLWARNLDANVTESAPAVADGTVFVADELDSMHALDLASGEVLWSTPFDGPTSPVVADGVVYAVRSGHELVAVDAASGERRFAYRPSQVPLSPPIVGDGVLYAANRERVLALEDA